VDGKGRMRIGKIQSEPPHPNRHPRKGRGLMIEAIGMAVTLVEKRTQEPRKGAGYLIIAHPPQ